ncbi:unnamed protein product [Mytilus coruscus]|uniref:Uncharacterized protein n=1 Tax=Mytilus coruscus TaxID=42192 RepID=A0A6J8D1Y3_MYTCO|nr:unnamed protein product [Mytilus coruscus]
MGKFLFHIFLVWSLMDSFQPKFIRFKENYEYLYKLHTGIDFKHVGSFQVKSKISYTVVENEPEYQEILLKVYNFNFRRSEDAVTCVTCTLTFVDKAEHEMDFSKWFSFQIKPNGQILRVYHPPEDDEVLATKKGLAAMLSAKLHDKDELSSESDMLYEQNEKYGEWKYQTEEIGNEGIGHLL